MKNSIPRKSDTVKEGGRVYAKRGWEEHTRGCLPLNIFRGTERERESERATDRERVIARARERGSVLVG